MAVRRWQRGYRTPHAKMRCAIYDVWGALYGAGAPARMGEDTFYQARDPIPARGYAPDIQPVPGSPDTPQFRALATGALSLGSEFRPRSKAARLGRHYYTGVTC